MPHYVDAILEYEMANVFSEVNEPSFDLEETRKWAVAAQLEADSLKEKVKNLEDQIEALKADLDICVKEKEALYNTLCPQ